MTPTISIITPSFNQGAFIEEAILSVLEQKHTDVEHIIIDGGSIDNTIEVLRKFPHLKWISEPDDGQADALNKGLRMAAGQIIGWLNADDKYLGSTFNLVLDFFTAHPEVALTYGYVYIIDEQSRVIRKRVTPEFDFDMMVRLATCYAQPTFFFRREVLTQVGFMDATLRQAMDYDFILKVGQKLTVRKLPRFLGCFRTHAGSMSHSGLGDSIGMELGQLIQRRYASPARHPSLLSWYPLRDTVILWWFKIFGRMLSIHYLAKYWIKKYNDQRSTT